MKDAFEAYQTYRTARSLFFWTLLAGLIILHTVFWIVDRGKIDAVLNFDQNQSESVFVHRASESSYWPGFIPVQTAPEAPEALPDEESDERSRRQMSQSLDTLIRGTLRFFNTVVCFMAVLYCLSLFIGMTLALVGRLGGLAESGKAFFLSLVVLVLVVPWPAMIAGQTPGTLFSYQELTLRYIESTTYTTLLSLDAIAYYVRFPGFWGLTMILLLVAHWRSCRAARQIAQRCRATQPAQTQAVVPVKMNHTPEENHKTTIPIE